MNFKICSKNYPEEYDKIKKITVHPKDIILILQDHIVSIQRNIYSFLL